MKIGLIIGVRVIHELTEQACNAARALSRPETPVVVVFNGTDANPPCVPIPLAEGAALVFRKEST